MQPDDQGFMGWIRKVWGFMLTILLLAVAAVLGWCTDLPSRAKAQPVSLSAPVAPTPAKP